MRGLAQRTADAAKDVEQGLRLVQEAGATIGHTVSSARRVMTAVDEIWRAMTAQSAGISDIGGTMEEVDRLTRQNAALVEQSAAAAVSLSDQSRRLSQAAAVFRVHADAGPPEEVRFEERLNGA